VHELIGGHDLVHEADRQRFLGRDHAAGQDQLERAGEADHAGQEVGAAIARHQSDLDEGRAELGPGPRDSQVAHAGEIEASADRRTIDRGDQRLGELGDAPRYRLDAANVAGPQLGWIAREHARARAHGLDVAAGVKGLAGAGQDHAADCVVTLGAIERGDELLAHFVAVGVARLRSVEGDGRQ
jgi:hypothetical protein